MTALSIPGVSRTDIPRSTALGDTSLSDFEPAVACLYLYEGGNPINRVDPLGLQATSPAKPGGSTPTDARKGHYTASYDNLFLAREIGTAKINGNSIEYTIIGDQYKIVVTCDDDKVTSTDKYERIKNLHQGQEQGLRTLPLLTTRPDLVKTDEEALAYVKTVLWPNTPAWYGSFLTQGMKGTEVQDWGPHPGNLKWDPRSPSTPPRPQPGKN